MNILGDCLLFRRKAGIISSVISRFTVSPYNHAAVITGYSNTNEGLDLFVVEAKFISGVVSSRYLYDPKVHSIYTHTDFTDSKRKEKVEYVASRIGKGYDWTAVLYRAYLTITFQWNRKNKWNDENSDFCSELDAAAMNAVGLLWSEKIPVNTISPADIENSKFSKEIHFDTGGK